MDQSKPQPKTLPAPESNPPPPASNPTNLEGVQAVPMPPSTSSAQDEPGPINRLEYLARPKVHQLEDTLKRFDTLLDSKSKTNLQRLATEQRKTMQTVKGHASCNPVVPTPVVRSRPTSALNEKEREKYFRALSDPKGYCLNDTLNRFGAFLEDGRRVKVEESVVKLLAAREASTSRHMKSCPSGVALKDRPASYGVPPPGYNAVEVAKTSKIANPSIHILEETLERLDEQLKPELKQNLEVLLQELKAQRETNFKHHIQNHLQNDGEPEDPPKSSLPADYDPLAIAETSKLSWPNQHVLQDTLDHYGKTLKPAATDVMKERIQDQSLRRQATHKQHLHDCHLTTPPRPRSARPSPSYDPIAVAKTSKVSIPPRHIVKDTLDRYGKVIKPAARSKMQQMIKERDADRKTTHKRHSDNCKYMRTVQMEAAERKKVGAHPPGYNPAEVAKTSKVSRPNRHVLKDTLDHYGETIKPTVKESMLKMMRDREEERKTTHKRHLLDCKLTTPPRPKSIPRPSPDYDPVAVAKTSKVSIPPRHILQDTLDHYGDVLKPSVRESLQQMIHAQDQAWEGTHVRHNRNCNYMREVREAAVPVSFPPPPGYDPDEVAKTSKIAQPYRHRLKDTLDRHGQSLPERAREYLLKILEEQRNLREVSTRRHRINCTLPVPPEPRELHHAYDEKNIVQVIEKFKAKLKREAFDHLTSTIFDHVPDLVLATDIAKLDKQDAQTQQLINVLYSTVASYNGKPVTAHDHELYVHLCTGLARFVGEVVDSVQREKDASDEKKKKDKKGESKEKDQKEKEKGKEDEKDKQKDKEQQKDKTVEKGKVDKGVQKDKKDKPEEKDKTATKDKVAEKDKKGKDTRKKEKPSEPSRSSMTTEIFGHLVRDMAYAQGPDRNVLRRIVYGNDQAAPSN